MICKLLNNFVRDIRVESVKIQMQIAVPHATKQKNPILGTIDYSTFDSGTIGGTLGTELRKLQELLIVENYLPKLKDIVQSWNETRIKIQYDGYGYGNQEKISRSEVYAYVLMLRILKKQHKELYKLIK